MGIFDRVGKVIQSNLNALLDKTQDDRKLVELNLDEMDGQIKEGHHEVVQAVAAEKQLQKRCEELRDEVKRWDSRAELALRGGDESLAREALKQKKRCATELESAERVHAEQADAAAKMKQDLERMKTRLSELRMRKGTLVAAARTARSGASPESLGARGKGSSAFDNFRRMEEKIQGSEAESAAMGEVDEALGGGTKAADLEAKFRELESRARTGGGGDVDDDLAALKKRIRV